MKNIKVQYDVTTGEITGYFPSDVEYSEAIKPYIEVSNEEYNQLLHNEEKFRVENKALVDISKSAEYQKLENKRLISTTEEKINLLAAQANEYGVIVVDETYCVNVGWIDYYKYLLPLIEKQNKQIAIKIYRNTDAGYCIDYLKLEQAEAQELVPKIISAIENYKYQYIPEKQQEYIAELNKIQASKKLTGIRNLYESINYGFILSESVPVLF